MNRRDIVIGLVVLAIIAGAIYFSQRNGADLEISEPTPTPTGQIERQLEETLQREVPEDVEKVELQDEDSIAIVTREEAATGGHLVTVLADLPQPEEGEFFQAFLERGEQDTEEFERVSLGRLNSIKGGYVVEFQSNQDLSEYNRVIISKQTRLSNEPEEVVLEGDL